MKKLLISAIAVALGLAATGAPSSVQARLGAKLEELKKEQLLKVFAIGSSIPDGVSQARIYELNAKGTRADGKIKLKLQFDASERLSSIEMLISQAYSKADPTDAKYYAALFLMSQTPLEDTAGLKPLYTEVEYRTEDPNYHILGDQPVLPAKATKGYQAVMGRASYNTSLKRSKLTVAPLKSGGGWTSIKLEVK